MIEFYLLFSDWLTCFYLVLLSHVLENFFKCKMINKLSVLFLDKYFTKEYLII